MPVESHLVIIQPSAFCNIDCKYCYVPNRSVKEIISDSTLENIFKKVLSYEAINGAVGFLWHIGEPMVVGVDFYKKAARLIQKWNIYGLSVTQKIQTNGLLINDDWCRLFNELNFSVSVSIDGPANLHDMNRVDRLKKGTHEHVMKGIATLKRHEINFGGLCVLTLESLNYPEDILRFFIENGFKSVGFNVEEISSLYTQSSFSKANFEAVKEKFIEFFDRMFDYWLACGRPIHVREFENNLRIIQEKKKNPNYIRNCEDQKALRIITIQLDGNISTFSPELASGLKGDLTKFVIGNINLIDSLEDLNLDPRYKEIKNAVKRGIENCRRSCDYFDGCGGGEPCVKFYEGGSFEATETTHCRLVHQALMDTLIHKLQSHSAMLV